LVKHKTGKNMPSSSTHKIKTSAFILVALSALFYCYEYILRISPNVMMPSIMQQFGLTAAGAGWLVSLYYFTYTPLQIFVGVIIDRFGAKKILAWAIAFCIIGSLVFPLSSWVAVAGLGRILIGIGSAFAYVGALAIANQTLNKEWFAFFAGAVTALGMVGALAGDIGMGYLISQYHWTTIFHITAAIGVVLLLAFLITVYINKRATHKQEDSGETVLCFIKLRTIIFNKRFILLGTIGAFLFLSLDIFAELWGPQFLEVARNISIHKATGISGMIFWGWAIGAPCQAIFYKLLKCVRRCFIIESLLATISICLALSFINGDETLLKTLLFLFGFFCSVQIFCFSLAVQWVKKGASATAVAVINFFVMLSGLIFQPLASEILNWGTHEIAANGQPIYTSADFFSALVVVPIATGIAFFLCFFLPKNENKPKKVA
jgi:MFS family permease